MTTNTSLNQLTQASRHVCSTVRVEVDVTDWVADSKLRDVSVDNFDVQGITGSQSVVRVGNAEKWSSRVQSDDCVDSAECCAFSSKAGDVGCGKDVRSGKSEPWIAYLQGCVQ